jgi:lipoprotein signal peptidase
MAYKLKKILPKIIFENQGVFMQKRKIVDNIIFVREAIDSSITNKEKGMIIKMGVGNIFDRVRHSFLLEVLHKIGFDESFVY